jgi:hypothetical protein
METKNQDERKLLQTFFLTQELNEQVQEDKMEFDQYLEESDKIVDNLEVNPVIKLVGDSKVMLSLDNQAVKELALIDLDLNKNRQAKIYRVADSWVLNTTDRSGILKDYSRNIIQKKNFESVYELAISYVTKGLLLPDKSFSL